MRIISRPDFDGIVCAALLYDALDIDQPVQWVEPNDMQSGEVEIRKGDIIANLSYNKNCTLWFDHHVSNQREKDFDGVFELAPSAACLIFDFFNHFDYKKNPGNVGKSVKKFQRDYTELIEATDRIDAAQLTIDEVLHPENYPYIAISMTILSHESKDESYWNHLVDLLRKHDIREVIKDPEVQRRHKAAIEKDKKYAKLVERNTTVNNHVSITDFRQFKKMPTGNRFLVFCIFPESLVNVKIRYHDYDSDLVIVSVGHNIFNRRSTVNTGLLCAKFGGGGHFGAGSCGFSREKIDEFLPVILETLHKNED
ncbi:MAG: exopolyphosphatase [bacterium]|nr:exopolyphosphatase [bacterium]